MRSYSKSCAASDGLASNRTGGNRTHAQSMLPLERRRASDIGNAAKIEMQQVDRTGWKYETQQYRANDQRRGAQQYRQVVLRPRPRDHRGFSSRDRAFDPVHLHGNARSGNPQIAQAHEDMHQQGSEDVQYVIASTIPRHHGTGRHGQRSALFFRSSDVVPSICNMPGSTNGFDALQKAFTEGYFSPSAYGTQEVVTRHQNWLEPRTQSMRAGIETLGLLQLSTQIEQMSITLQAGKTHCLMLSLYQEELNRQDRIDYLAAAASAGEVLLCQVSERHMTYYGIRSAPHAIQ